ncbi:MAG: proprotein convertase P-domain-containing protein [Planctomycetota bacterium]
MAKKRATKKNTTRKKPGIYTYRDGTKLELQKETDRFVVRQLPKDLPESMSTNQRVSGSSTRVSCSSTKLESLMKAARELAPTHHGYRSVETGDDFLITDRIIVTFKQTPSVEELGEFLAKYALQIVEEWSDNEFLLRLTNDTGMNPVKLVVKLHEDEDSVESVDHDLNFSVEKSQVTLPDDPFYDQQWHLHRRMDASTDYDPRASVRCEEAWQLLGNFGSSDVAIGVTDDGCQLDHPDFNSAGKFSGWGYFEGNTLLRRGDAGAQPAKMYEAGADHGTSCSGVIAAEVDSEATVGAASGCRLAPIKWESSGPRLFISDSKVRTAFRYLDSRVDIISNSWGGRPITRWATATKRLIREMAATGGRRGKGVVFLWAAGNENCPVHHTSTQDIPFDSGVDPSGPFWVGVRTARTFVNELVGIPGNMQVAALASTAQRSHYSNYGTGIDITAPSSNSHTYHRLRLPGFGITTAKGVDRVTSIFGGTSSATPLVAGIAALVISANPDLTALEVISLLKQTASKDLNMTDWPKTQPASFDRDTSWDVSPVSPFDSGAFQNNGLADGTWSPWFGHGRVDALDAVQRAIGRPPASVSASSTVALDIPDNTSTGVVSRVEIREAGTIQSLEVAVDIKHSFRGDLEVRLVSPSGTRVLLHDREGGGRDDLSVSYDVTNLAALSSLTGESIQGVWSLEVADRAPADTGTLKSWRLHATIAQSDALEVESDAGLSIADADPDGVTDSIRISDPRAIGGIEVSVDITHTFIGDLQITLDNGSGSSVVLHDQIGEGTDNLRRKYTPSDIPGLASFVNQPAAGNWTLKVADLVSQDTGKLNRWGLRIT